MADAGAEEAERGLGSPMRPRPPSLLDALAPIVVLIVLIALTIALFGVGATDGPLQVALLLSAAFPSLVAFKNGYTMAEVTEATRLQPPPPEGATARSPRSIAPHEGGPDE